MDAKPAPQGAITESPKGGRRSRHSKRRAFCTERLTVPRWSAGQMRVLDNWMDARTLLIAFWTVREWEELQGSVTQTVHACLRPTVLAVSCDAICV